MEYNDLQSQQPLSTQSINPIQRKFDKKKIILAGSFVFSLCILGILLFIAYRITNTKVEEKAAVDTASFHSTGDLYQDIKIKLLDEFK